MDDLLLLVRADAAAPPARAVRVDVCALVSEVAGRLEHARVPVVARTDGPQWTVGDPDELRRVLANLADNAVRHAHGRVVLAVEPDGPTTVTVTVTDDGPGIPAGDRERVFDRFTRLDDARARDGGGTGLGLAIVRELVRRNGGTVRLADAAPGVRAEVRLTVSP